VKYFKEPRRVYRTSISELFKWNGSRASMVWIDVAITDINAKLAATCVRMVVYIHNSLMP
jgi:hypothetical protein